MSATVTQLPLKPWKPRRGDLYYDLEKTEYIRVSSVLDEVAKPALQFWAAKEAAKFAFANPEASLQEAAAAPQRNAERAANKGKLLHSILEARALGNDVDLAGVPEGERDQAKELWSFFNDQNPEVIFAETSVYNRTFGYAGTLDLLLKVRDRILLVDLKTGKGVYPDMAFQQSAYSHAEFAIKQHTAFEQEEVPMPKADATYILHVPKGQPYSLVGLPDKWTEFRSYLHLFRNSRNLSCPDACYCMGGAA